MDIIKRNTEIVRLMMTANYTLDQVGQVFGISRERVRQILKRTTGKGAMHYRTIRSKRKRTRWLNQILFNCAGCGKVVKRKDGSHKKKFCQACRDIQVLEQRDPILVHVCEVCGESFHPYRNVRYIPKCKGRFCSMVCYIKNMKEHPITARRIDHEKVIETRKMGMTYQEIADLFDCSTGCVYKILRRGGLIEKREGVEK